MESSSYRQGYYIGLFLMFIWKLFIYTIFQFMIMYMFGVNLFTFWVLIIVLSFFINTSLPMKESYPFFRHILIILCSYVVNVYMVELLNGLFEFFTPNTLWKIIMCVSLFSGVLASFGKRGNGTHSGIIESFGNLSLLALIILTFILFWWEGGVVYIAFRIPIIFFEVLIANQILYLLMKSNQTIEIDEEHTV